MIRTLRTDEPIPESVPSRYVNDSGYVRLRWRVGPDRYVEEYEHRVVTGRPAGMQVHHVNGDKADNRRENLLVCTAAEHTRIHHDLNRAAGAYRGSRRAQELAARRAAAEQRWLAMAAAYQAGMSTTEVGAQYGLDSSNVSRGLRARGYTMRPFARVR